METIFAQLALCEGKPPVTGVFPSQKVNKASFDIFFDVRLNKRITKQWSRRWFETPGCSLWRHYNWHSDDQNTDPVFIQGHLYRPFEGICFFYYLLLLFYHYFCYRLKKGMFIGMIQSELSALSNIYWILQWKSTSLGFSITEMYRRNVSHEIKS